MTPAHYLIKKLEDHHRLSDDEKGAIEQLPFAIRWHPKHTQILREGEASSECTLVLEGLLCRYKIVLHGQRQILSFHIAGDVPDLQSLHLGAIDYNLGSIAATKVARSPVHELVRLTRRFPSLGEALWRETLVDAAVTRSWLTGIGRRTAHQRVAHLICEIFLRMANANLASGDRFLFPVTQAEAGDSLGLSSVHVNRIFQTLRKDGLIVRTGKHIEIKNWKELQRLADFDPSYLNLDLNGQSLPLLAQLQNDLFAR